ncbi:MAG: BlaI/MecI/CopY family transcriptional regulator [Acetatifactor sp.]|nr:BlaI/MecI/CopY family transcriptional regulator [Acetatifactor sp.]
MQKEVNMKELSTAEWHVMESLWENSPKVGSRVVADLRDSVGWSRSTTLTMLKRMTDKGLIVCEDGENMKVYRPLLEREEAAQKETESFLERVYQGSLSMLVNHFVEKQSLSREEIAELRRILDQADEK